ncbi:hypothetical protein [Flaviflagellibacter deserti]|uniref:HTH cro/C1-type domain-containing protein n=1 Tax=Flaviflagellibacter deserti TaxID=2267266 RepID=A0ABV9YUV9_9HYPH
MTEWHDAAVRDFETGDFSYGDLALKYGRSESTLMKLMKRREAHRGEGNRRRGGRKRFGEQKPISPLHYGVGVQIGMYRALEQANVSEIGERLNTSRITASSMEKGFHDFTLTELIGIATMIGTDLIDLVSTRTHQIKS